MRNLLIGAGLFGILALSSYFAVVTWIDLGEVALGWFGWLMLGLGSLLTVALGGGLMALVFYSARRGHDEAHHDQSVFRPPSRAEEPAPDEEDAAGGRDESERR